MMDMDSIYREQANAVFKYLMTLCYEEDTAQELTQETFYQAVKSADKYNGSCKVSTWLCQIAKHLWYQELDRRKRKGTSQLDENLVSPKAALEEELCIKDGIIPEGSCFGGNCQGSRTSSADRRILLSGDRRYLWEK